MIADNLGYEEKHLVLDVGALEQVGCATCCSAIAISNTRCNSPLLFQIAKEKKQLEQEIEQCK